MAEKSTFGIDAKIVEKLDFDLAIKRISFDIKSDFILAPHLSCVYLDSSAELINDVRSLVLSGHFAPQLPMLIDVPKRQRIKPFGIKRLTPNLVRSGGILFPRDRVLMQVLADRAQPIIETKLDRTVCF